MKVTSYLPLYFVFQLLGMPQFCCTESPVGFMLIN